MVSFIRRVTLDLAGRIPTIAELDDYLHNTDADRKQQLIARLIESPDFVFQQRDQLDILLLQRDEYNDRWREYLLEAVRENRPWDQLFRETMLRKITQPVILGQSHSSNDAPTTSRRHDQRCQRLVVRSQYLLREVPRSSAGR